MSWTDPNVPMPSTGYGKFELTVHSNGCYTVGTPPPHSSATYTVQTKTGLAPSPATVPAQR